MTQDEYGAAYKRGYQRTVRFLLGRKICREAAEEFAQEAWAIGWEKQEGLREPNFVGTWVNRIALNLWRLSFRRKEMLPLEEAGGPMTEINFDAIDARTILFLLKPRDRLLLEQFYFWEMTDNELAFLYGDGITETGIRVRIMRARDVARDKVHDRRPHKA